MAQREPVPQGPPGVGDHLHDMLVRWLGVDKGAGCGCGQWIARMNAWGAAGCRDHRAEIVEHLVNEAERRKWWIMRLPGSRTAAAVAAGKLVDWAIEKARN